jgi:hypothetical protein
MKNIHNAIQIQEISPFDARITLRYNDIELLGASTNRPRPENAEQLLEILKELTSMLIGEPMTDTDLF